jgi:hypothetical protein
MSYLYLTLALTAANYFYQFTGHLEWKVAFERSFFQALALLAAFLLQPR